MKVFHTVNNEKLRIGGLYWLHVEFNETYFRVIVEVLRRVSANRVEICVLSDNTTLIVNVSLLWEKEYC